MSRYPDGYKSYSRSKPLTIEEFDQEKKWWGGAERRGRKTNEFAWKVSTAEIVDRNYNLDVVGQNPHRAEVHHGDPEELVAEYQRVVDEVQLSQRTLKAELMNSLQGHHLSQAAKMLERHFDNAFAAPDGIKKLRELILTLAIQGKLLSQTPSDPPASEILREIERDKMRLIRDGKIKEPKPLPTVSPEERPYALPEGWEWVRMGDFTEIVRGITFPANEKTKEPGPGKIACLRTTNVQKELEWNDLLFIDRKFMGRTSQIVRLNDIVMSMANSRELVGKVAIVRKIPVAESTFGGFLGVIRTYRALPAYVHNVLNSRYARNSLIESASQTTNIANVSLGKLNTFLVPFPPRQEQQRIVAKIDQLMSVCDTIEKQIDASRKMQSVLLDALMAQFEGQ
jgi:type I restriction enzyme S subunit